MDPSTGSVKPAFPLGPQCNATGATSHAAHFVFDPQTVKSKFVV